MRAPNVVNCWRCRRPGKLGMWRTYDVPASWREGKPATKKILLCQGCASLATQASEIESSGRRGGRARG